MSELAFLQLSTAAVYGSITFTTCSSARVRKVTATAEGSMDQEAGKYMTRSKCIWKKIKA